MVNTIVVLTLVWQSFELVLSQRSTTLTEEVNQPTKNKHCPTWMYFSNTTGNCTCGEENREIIVCNNKTQNVMVLDGYVMTYNDLENDVKVGQSLFGWRRKFKGRKIFYYHVEQNKENLNHTMCSRFNREGRLCGKCKKGYSPLVYSYKLTCMHCSNTSLGINTVKLIAAAYLPLTAFYLLVVFIRFNANSPALQAYILVAQTIGSPAASRFIISQYSNSRVYALFSAFIGIWNLDFFRLLYPDICLNVSTMTALSLDYSIAFYPLFLIFLTYMATRLHSQGYKLIILAWRPFKRFLSSKWDSKSSLIDVMATFMLLSYTKTLSVSFDFLYYTYTFNIHGKVTGLYLYNDPTITYFAKEHCPYAIMAILFTSVFNIFPLLLLLFYPMNCFQKFLNFFHLSHVALHTFVESFLGYYKDGTEPGTRDCRYVGAMFLLLRVIFYVALVFTKNVSFLIIYSLAGVVFIIIFVIFKPYKAQYSVYNTITVVLYLTGSGFFESFIGLFISEIIHDQEYTLFAIGSVFIVIHALYIVALAVWWIWKHNPMKLNYLKFRKLNQERSLTTTTLFNAAERRDCTGQYYGALSCS